MPLFKYSFVNQAMKGTAYGIKTGSNEYIAGTDQCWNNKRLLEFFCDIKANKVTWNSYNCVAGTSCVDGACVKPIEQIELTVKQDPNDMPFLIIGDWWGYGNYLFEANKGQIAVKKLRLKPIIDDPNLVSANDYKEILLSTANGWTYKTTPSDLNEIVIDLPADALVVGAGVVINSPTSSTAKLSLGVQPWAVGLPNPGTSGHVVGYKIINPIDAIDVATGNPVKVNYKEAGNYHFLHKSFPLINKESLSTNKLMNGTRDLYKFKVYAQIDDVGLYKFSFEVVPTVAKVSNLELYDVTWSNDLLVGQLSQSAGGTIWETTGKDWLANFLSGEVTVAKNTPHEFVLRGNVTGATTGSAIGTALLYQPANVIMNKPWTTAAGVNGTFVWSDRSSAAHTTNTSDWTDGTKINGPDTNSNSKLEVVAY